MTEFSQNLPNIGDGVIEGEIVEWFVKIGDLVQTDDPIVSVITDKATVKIPYHFKKSTYVSKLHGEVGDMISVNSPLITLSGETEEDITTDFEYVMDKIMEVDSRLLAQIGGTYRSFLSEGVLEKKVITYKKAVTPSSHWLSTNKFDRRHEIFFIINFFLRNEKLHQIVYDELSMERKSANPHLEPWKLYWGHRKRPMISPSLDDTKIAAYIDLGLEENYAKAIVAGIDAEEIMALWEADWRKQYESDDFLIDAVLTGKITTNDAEYLNQIRSDHNDLVYACLNEKVSIEWAKALMDAGFNTHPNAVNSILRGTDPAVTARLLNLDVNIDLLPPKLA